MAQDPNAVIQHPKVCFVGGTGAGKSSFGTALLRDYNNKASEPFKVCHDAKAGTIKTTRKQGKFLCNLDLSFVDKSEASDGLKEFVNERGNSVQKMTVVDTEGLQFNKADKKRVTQIFKSLITAVANFL